MKLIRSGSGGRGVVALDELDHATDPGADEVGAAGVHAEPEDQLVEEQDDARVAEGLGVAGELLQAASKST
jgi:hypothetical protein